MKLSDRSNISFYLKAHFLEVTELFNISNFAEFFCKTLILEKSVPEGFEYFQALCCSTRGNMCSVNLIDVSFPGVSDPVLRKLTRNQILNPTTTNEALTSMNSDNRDAFSEESVYIALVVGTAVLAVVLIIILLLVLINIKR